MTIAEMIARNAEKADVVATMQGIMLELQAYVETPKRVLKKHKGNCSGRACPEGVACDVCPHRPRRNYLKDAVVPQHRNGYLEQDDLTGFMHGFEYLGSGHFGTVYKHIASGLVVKITGYGCGGLDTYPVFAQFCIDNKSKANPLEHLPDVLHLEESEGAYFVVMRQYYPSTCISNDERRNMKAIIEGSECTMDIPVDRRDSVTQTCQALAILAEYSVVDLHSGNVMQDANGSPVITDPFSFVSAGSMANTARPNHENIVLIDDMILTLNRKGDSPPMLNKVHAASVKLSNCIAGKIVKGITKSIESCVAKQVDAKLLQVQVRNATNLVIEQETSKAKELHAQLKVAQRLINA